MTLFVVLWIPTPALGQESVDQNGSDIDQYARDLNLSRAQAEENLKLQTSAVDLNERLQLLAGDEYGGVEFVHIPEFQVRVFVPLDADVDAVEALLKEYDEFKSTVNPVEFSQADLLSAMREVSVALEGVVTHGAILTDVPGQRVVLQVPQESTDRVQAAIPRLLPSGIPVDIQPRDDFEQPATSGAQDAGTCSVAFTTRSISSADYGRLGVATAGHCQTNGENISDHPEMPDMTYQMGGILNEIHDISWAVAPVSEADYDDLVRGFGTQTPSISSVGGNAARGQHLCVRGDDSTGPQDAPDWSCAWVYTNQYCVVNWGTCDANPESFDGAFLLLLDPAQRIIDGGDSGSGLVDPINSTTAVAYGVVSGGSPNPNPTWNEDYTFGGMTCPQSGCFNATFTAAHWLNDAPVSLEILTSSPPTCDGLNVTHWGTSSSETIVGTSGNDVIHGGSGNDTIQGNNGNDIICGGPGDDIINGGNGNDELIGEAGTDECHGGAGVDIPTGCEVTTGTEDPGDELLFYKSSGGAFSYYDILDTAVLASPINSGSYASGWEEIASPDLEPDGTDELLFYDSTGTFSYHNVSSSGVIGSALNSGTYSAGWTSVVRVDIDGDSDDELLFYNSVDGAFRYYDVSSAGALGSPINSGTYTTGWDVIAAVDLDGNNDDELLFYDTGGSFKYYSVSSAGALGSPINTGTYTTGWDVIAAVDLAGDNDDELLFYDTGGSFKYYSVSSAGVLGSPINTGTYSSGWTVIVPVEIDSD